MKRLVLINAYPEKHFGEENISVIVQMPLNLAYIAALTPRDEWDVDVIDETLERAVDAQGNLTCGRADLVGVTGVTYQAPRMYEIAQACRRAGVPVGAGGAPPTHPPEKASTRVDQRGRGGGGAGMAAASRRLRAGAPPAHLPWRPDAARGAEGHPPRSRLAARQVQVQILLDHHHPRVPLQVRLLLRPIHPGPQVPATAARGRVGRAGADRLPRTHARGGQLLRLHAGIAGALPEALQGLGGARPQQELVRLHVAQRHPGRCRARLHGPQRLP